MTICTQFRAWLGIASIGLLIVFAGSAYAIVQNVTVVTDTGQPVANATVTIVFPNGTEQEEETDDRGVLIFNFPGNGSYLIRYPGGEMSYAVTGAATGGAGNTVKWVAGGALAAAIVVVSTDGNGDSNSSNDSSSGSDPGGSDPGGSDPGGSVDGTYNCSFSESSNADGHPTGTLNGDYVVTTSDSSLDVSHSSGGTDFTASGSISSNSSTFSGSGSFEGFTGAQVSGGLDFDSSGASGTLEVVCSACPDSNSNSTADPVQGNLSCSI